MLAERDAVLLAAVDAHPEGRSGVRVLDLGCGSGEVLRSLREAGVEAHRLRGLDVRPDAVAAARRIDPALDVQLTDPDHIAAPNSSVDVLVAFTLFSSVQDPAIARPLAEEVERVLAPGGVLVWYDLRVPSPGNRTIRPWPEAAVRELLPGLHGWLRPITLLPPLARRLGPATDLLYPRLSVGRLRTHLVGVLQKPV
jgi:SAM-dependent methyltransferase